jgi:tetratricopeptide (TPR) repeat protein
MFLKDKLKGIFLTSLILLLINCASTNNETETYWSPIDPSQKPYFSQYSAQCQIYAKNSVAGQQPYVTPGPDAGIAMAQGLLGVLSIGISQDEAYNQCMLAKGWEIKTRYTNYGIDKQYFEKAKNLFELKKFDELESLSRSWMREQPNQPASYSFLANAFIEKGNNLDALNLINMSIEKGNKNYSIYLNRGLVNSQLGKYEESIADFDKCLTINPSYLNCQKNKNNSKIYIAKKLYESHQYEKSIEILKPLSDSGDLYAASNLAYVYTIIFDLKNKEKALEVFELYRKASEAGIPEAQYNLGRHYAIGIGVNKDLEKATTYFKKSADQNYPYGQYNYALHKLRGLGTDQDSNEAKIWFQKCLNNPSSSENLKLFSKQNLSNIK